MKIYDFFSIKKNTKSKVIALGGFQLLHIGHKKIIEKVIEISHQKKLDAFFMLVIRNPFKKDFLLEKEIIIEFLEKNGIENVLLIDLEDPKQNISREEFICFLKKNKFSYFVYGSDFKFGKNKLGDKNFLINYFGPEKNIIIKKVKNSLGKTISTTDLKELITTGNLSFFNRYSLIFFSLINFLDLKNNSFFFHKNQIIIADAFYGGYVYHEEFKYHCIFKKKSNFCEVLFLDEDCDVGEKKQVKKAKFEFIFQIGFLSEKINSIIKKAKENFYQLENKIN